MLKAVSLILIMVLTILSLGNVNTNAISTKQKTLFDDNTIVTEDNINEILDSLNIKHGQLEKNTSAKKSQKNYTVCELKKALKKMDRTSSSKEKNVYLKVKNLNCDSYVYAGIKAKKDKIINKTISRTEAHDGYNLDYYVYVKYNKTKKKFIETTGQGVDIDSDLLPIVYKIAKKSTSSSCTSNKVTMKAKITVNAYIGLGNVGLIKVASQKMTVNMYWYE